jgi:hypothetical protein
VANIREQKISLNGQTFLVKLNDDTRTGIVIDPMRDGAQVAKVTFSPQLYAAGALARVETLRRAVRLVQGNYEAQVKAYHYGVTLMNDVKLSESELKKSEVK